MLATEVVAGTTLRHCPAEYFWCLEIESNDRFQFFTLALFHLSYRGMAGDVGFKPTRKRFGGSSALQCYRLKNLDKFWYPRQDSNLQWVAPPVSKTGASANFATRVFGATEGTRTLDIPDGYRGTLPTELRSRGEAGAPIHRGNPRCLIEGQASCR